MRSAAASGWSPNSWAMQLRQPRMPNWPRVALITSADLTPLPTGATDAYDNAGELTSSTLSGTTWRGRANRQIHTYDYVFFELCMVGLVGSDEFEENGDLVIP
jgi:hypothetical protein